MKFGVMESLRSPVQDTLHILFSGLGFPPFLQELFPQTEHGKGLRYILSILPNS